MAYALYISILFGLKPRTIELQSAITTIAAIIVQFRQKVHMQILTDCEVMYYCAVIAGTDKVYNTYMHGCCTILYNFPCFTMAFFSHSDMYRTRTESSVYKTQTFSSCYRGGTLEIRQSRYFPRFYMWITNSNKLARPQWTLRCEFPDCGILNQKCGGGITLFIARSFCGICFVFPSIYVIVLVKYNKTILSY